MTDANTVSTLAWVSVVLNIITVILLVFLVGMWIKSRKKHAQRSNKMDNHEHAD